MNNLPRTPAPVWLKTLALRVGALATLWWILTEGMPFEWVLPSLAILAAAIGSLLVWPPGAWPWRLVPLARFLPSFCWQSLLGGVDVAWRALHPALPVRPGLVEFPLRLRGEPARVLFVWLVNLLPGTAVAGLWKDRATIHTLDVANTRLTESLRALEIRIAAIFGETLAS